jgi:hypothetical protein
LAGTVRQLEQQLAQQWTNLAHLDATMQLSDSDLRPQEICPCRQRAPSTFALFDGLPAAWLPSPNVGGFGSPQMDGFGWKNEPASREGCRR